MSFSYWFERK